MEKRPNPLLETLSARGRKAFYRVKADFAFAVGTTLELDALDRAGMYFIDKGKVEVEHTYPERDPRQITTRVAGQYFGEYSVLDGTRKMTVRVLEDTSGVWIPANRFGSLAEAEPSFVLNLTRMVLQQQAEYDEKQIAEMRKAREESERKIERLEAVATTSEALNTALNLDRLLEVILQASRVLTSAECGTIYLIDQENDELYSYMNEKGHCLRINMPLGKGIAGTVAQRGVPINIEDAYKDPRFNPEVDQETGYRSRSVLTMPIMNPTGEVLGVLQLLNKDNEAAFTHDDEQLLATFGGHAAIALERTRTAEAMMRNNSLIAVGNLAASIVHDLKSPLTVIQGYVDLLSFTAGSDEQRSHIEHISQQLNRMVGMTQEVLDFARGQVRLNPVKTRVNDYVAEICESFELEMDRNGVEMHLSFEGDADWTILMDRDRLTRVFHNLITNAREAMPGGGTLEIMSRQRENDWELIVRDTGVGISPGRLETIFEPFSTHGKKNGTGLGLSIAKSVIEEHGGEIQVSSVVGKGTTFEIHLPHRPKMASKPRLAVRDYDKFEELKQIAGEGTENSGPSLN